MSGEDKSRYTAEAASFYNKAKKKYHKMVVHCINEQEDRIMHSPLIGEKKVGDLSEVYVYKFQFIGQDYLLAYMIDSKIKMIKFLYVAVHENFYRDLKRKIFSS